MGNAAWDRASGMAQRRRRRAWRPWSWCTVCNAPYLYHIQVDSDSACQWCTAALSPQLQQPQGRALFQQWQQALVQQVQTKRAAASPAPAPVPAAMSLGGSLTASSPPAAQSDIGTSEHHEMGATDHGKPGDADRPQDDEAQRVQLARVQLLADVQFAGDEQRK